MKKAFNRNYKLNKKAFTLIELLGVIVIIGLIIIIAFPSMKKLINNNDEQELTNYYTLIEEASHLYASKLNDDLGGSKNQGCAEITLDDLMQAGYVKEFNNKDVVCETGDGNIKIRNDKGRISVNFQLLCKEDGVNKEPIGTNDVDTCDSYNGVTNQTLKETIENDSSLSKSKKENEDVYYITGSTPNNYVWYSGKLWQVVSYDTKQVKMVTANSITSIYYNHNNTNEYNNSVVETWINEDFFYTLQYASKFITTSTWDIGSSTEKNKVGLINVNEFDKIKSWYSKEESWLLPEDNSKKSYASGNQVKTIDETDKSVMLGVRPAVVLNSNVVVYSGTGKSDDPYIINNSDAFGKTEDFLTTRLSGEYVKIGEDKYRIVSSDNGMVKVIGTKSVKFVNFGNIDYESSSLKTTLETEFNSIEIIIEGMFCLDTIAPEEEKYYLSPNCSNPSNIKNFKIGLPKVGDFFTTNLPEVENEYWTINPRGTDTVNIVTPTGKVASESTGYTNDTVVVFYLNPMTKIVGGLGTKENPYEVSI